MDEKTATPAPALSKEEIARIAAAEDAAGVVDQQAAATGAAAESEAEAHPS